MGTSTNGILAYGIDLGEDFGFDYDEPQPAWIDDEDDEAPETVLLAANGFTEPEPDITTDRDGWRSWRSRQRDAKKDLGVELVHYCSGDVPMYILAAKHFEVYRGDTEEVDFDLPKNANERLAWALDVLGLDKFKDQRPKWLLASWWG